jgi:chromosome transmission fidelity protein 8
MPSIPLHTTPSIPPVTPAVNPLPPVLHTASGLALIEIQGTINVPTPPASTSEDGDGMELDAEGAVRETPVGRIVFPDGADQDLSKNKQVFMYVGKHQRLTGEAKKLATPLGILRRRDTGRKREEEREGGEGGEETLWDGEELEIVEVVKWKLLFSQRPEPVS